MIPELKQSLPRCNRCQGKMLLDKETGDTTCFTCGSVVYARQPMEHDSRRTISHAGQNLS